MNLIIFIVGMIVGAILRYVFCERKTISGNFIMDFSNPDKDICRLDLHEDLNDIYVKKEITLKVKTHDMPSSK